MRTYVIATGLVFGLLLLAHVARVAVEGIQVAKDPYFVLATLVAAGLSLWAWRLVKQPASSQ